MGEVRGELSIEMRRFNSLEVARPFLYKFLGTFIAYELFIAVLLIFLSSLQASLLAILLVVFLGSFGAFFIYQKSPLLRVPLAVNLNHPFMGDLELGTAMVMVQFSDGTWGDVGEGRVRLTVDELIGG
ncbi:MAG: hypothetical protein NLN65_05365, partial [Candidatus Poseidoniaceae archaeon]|nr:hypothetical protein [Candidatus Poseidoniaceae archaeon]